MRIIILVLMVLGSVISCGRIPGPVGYDYETQKKMQAGRHWDILAADTANEINRELILNEYINTPVFVRETCGNENTPCGPDQTTTFNESFRDLLITELVRLGVPTSSVPHEDAITVNYKAQTIYHHAHRFRTIQPGLITALATGITVFRDAPSEIVTILTAGALDYANITYIQQGHFEVVITTSMIDKNRYIYRNSSIYYINDKDSWHYQQPSAPAEIELTATAAPPAEEESREEPVELPKPIIPESSIQGTTEI